MADFAAAQAAGDVLAANGILMDAFYTDVRPGLAAYRAAKGLPADPMAAYAASGYGATIAESRVGGAQAKRRVRPASGSMAAPAGHRRPCGNIHMPLPGASREAA